MKRSTAMTNPEPDARWVAGPTGLPPETRAALNRAVIATLERNHPGIRWSALEDDGAQAVSATPAGQVGGGAGIGPRPDSDPVDGGDAPAPLDGHDAIGG